jgi:hypothetical protein
MVVSWKEIYVCTFNEREREKNRKRNNMKNKFEHERNNKEKNSLYFVHESIRNKVNY